MKKIQINSVAAFLLASIVAGTAYSQDSIGDLARNKEKTTINRNGQPAQNGAQEYEVPASRNEISAKAQRNFLKNYKDATGAEWKKVSTGFVVTFKQQDTKTSVFYTRNGIVDCTINYYSADKLPENVRHLVKTNFYDYEIGFVTEVNKNGITSYLVKIEDSTSIKTVKVIGGEWEVVEELRKEKC